MKNYFYQSSCVLLVTLSQQGAWAEQSNQTGSASMGDTAGITATVQVSKIPPIFDGPKHAVDVSLRLRFDDEAKIEHSRKLAFTYPGTNFYAAVSNGTAVLHDPSQNWLYFMATNSFVGPMELRDASGAKLQLLQPDIISSDSYPAQYSLSQLWERSHARHAYPCPLVPETGMVANVRGFALEDYFKVEKPGDYVLTIWPRIYKRVAAGADLCQRIDVPPVSVTVTWP